MPCAGGIPAGGSRRARLLPSARSVRESSRSSAGAAGRPLHLPAALSIPLRQRGASFRTGNESCLHVDVCMDVYGHSLAVSSDASKAHVDFCLLRLY